MKDIPVFTTEHGVASLGLREIPYSGSAYIRIQSSQEPALLIEECVSFCKMAGAEKIYGAGHTALETYPFHTAVWKMQCSRDSLGETDAALWPVQEDTLSHWLEIYNRKAAQIPGAAWMSMADGRKMLQIGDGYFVHRSGKLLGIGRAAGDQITWVASCQPGAGEDVVLALIHAITEDVICLQVASANAKAVSLYKRLGFMPCEELVRWYKIF